VLEIFDILPSGAWGDRGNKSIKYTGPKTVRERGIYRKGYF
jgi:hypothetical protein